MLDAGFIDFNPPESTPSGFEVRVDQSPAKVSNDLKINLQDFSDSTRQVTTEPEFTADLQVIEDHLDKICTSRMKLLAAAYSATKTTNQQKEMLARIEMIENEIDSTAPRYGEAEWKLLESFNKAIEAL